MNNSPAMRDTPTAQLVDLKLDGGLPDFVTSRRAQGRSWRLISRDLYEATGIDVTYETLRGWFTDTKAGAA